MSPESHADRNLRLWDAWQAGDGSARGELIARNLRLAKIAAEKFALRRGVDLREATSVARTGLVVAVGRWDPSRGKLSTAAYWSIWHELEHAPEWRRDVPFGAYLDGLDGGGSSPAERDAAQEEAARVLALCDRLPLAERRMVREFHRLNSDVDALCRAMRTRGMSDGSTRDTIRRGLARLRSLASEAA